MKIKERQGYVVLLILLIATLVELLSGCTTPPPDDFWDGVFPEVRIGGGVKLESGAILRNRRGERIGSEADFETEFELKF